MKEFSEIKWRRKNTKKFELESEEQEKNEENERKNERKIKKYEGG